MPTVTVTAVKRNGGANSADLVSAQNKAIFVPQTPEVFMHDADGNLTDDARWHYTWDGENRLVAMETADAAGAAGVKRQKLEFGYDSQSRRVTKKAYSSVSGAWQQTESLRFLYDGWNLIAEVNDAGAGVRTYAWGIDLSGSMQGAGGVGGLLFATVGSGTHAPAFDGNGNVLGYFDLATGTRSATFDYAAFGEPLVADGGPVADFPFRFSTKYTDRESGVIYYGLRYYSPSTGRWLSRDPIEEDGGVNLHGFTDNNQINRIDRLGMAVKYFDGSGITPTHADSLGFRMVNGQKLWTQGRTIPEPTRAVYTKEAGSCCTEIVIIGSLSIRVKILSGADDIRGRNGYTPPEHEFIHVNDFKTGWNAYAKIANALEGKWCGKDCASKALALEQAAYELYTNYTALVAKNFDHYEYDLPFDGEQARYDAAVAELIIKTAELTSTCARP